MTTDLWMLIATGLLSLAVPIIYATGRSRTPGGFFLLLGNRPQPVVGPQWAERARRAHENLTENLAPFAIIVLVAHAAGKSNSATALGASIFFAGRLAHVVVYTLGVPYLRTAVWVVGWVGGFIVLAQLFLRTA